jgi:hypothetical protein
VCEDRFVLNATKVGALFGTLLLFLPAALSAKPPPLTQIVTDQASVEADFTASGLKFNLNSAWQREFVAGVVTRDVAIAVGSIFPLECTPSPGGGTSCGGAWLAPCYPAGNAIGDSTLPAKALRFWPHFGRATLEADFDCTRSDTGEVIRLEVDLKWRATSVLFSDETISENPGPPPTVTYFVRKFAFPVPVSGSAFDGTTEYVDASTNGALSHRSITTVAAE